ncbi:MAG TPA: type II secretion system F family protein [Jatrophihabitans sp.]|nr:type II secretion system F family protein [Jatrophihabitans sp.]
MSWLAALGLTLALCPPPDPARDRLRWLAGSRLIDSLRLPSAGAGPAFGRRRAWTVLAGIRWEVRAGVLAAVAAAAAWIACHGNPLLVGVAAVSGWTLCWCGQLLAAERAGGRDRVALAAAAGALAEEYAAGAGLGIALRSAASAAGRFGSMLAEAGLLIDYGAEPQPALGREPLLAPLAAACTLATRSGASIGSLLAGVRADLVAERATRSAVQTAVAGPRSSAALLAGLPAVGLAMGAAMGGHPVRVLVGTPAGSVVLTVGVLLDLLGLIWTLRMTRQRP